MVDLANGLQVLIQAEKDFAKSQATKTSSLDNVIEPLSERVAEWRKSDQPRGGAQQRSRLLRKGSSTENLINKMGSVMTLSRKSRKPSRDRKPTQEDPREMPMVGRDTLVSTTTEAQARMSIFARSLTPYIQSHSEVSKKAEVLANSDLNKCARINQQTVNHWIDNRIRDMTNYNYETPVRRHQRKSSISSISSSKSDSNSSGSANPVIISDINEIDSTLPKQRAQSSLALIRPEDYRLSTTSHDSGFTSHEQIDIQRTNSLPRPHLQRNQTKRFEASSETFNLPAPPPELLLGIGPQEPLNISCPNLEQSGPQSPSARSTGSSNASVPLSPYLHHQPKTGIIESGIATIRRNPSKLNRLGSIGSNVRIPVIPSSPAKPPLPPKRQGSTLSSN